MKEPFAGSRRLVAGLLLLLSVGAALAQKQTGDDEQALQELVDRYFRTWSAADIETYGATFHPQAVVYHVAEDGRVNRSDLAPFLRGQRRAHAISPGMREYPLSVDLRLATRDHASALVHWELDRGSEIVRGYDHFHFLRTDDGWRVLSIVFHDEP